jgi:hypothetical protein
MGSFENKHFKWRSLKKILFYFLLVSTIPVFNECSSQKHITAAEKSAKIKKSLNKKRDEERQEAREKFREDFYKNQAPSTRKRIEYNAQKSEEWRKNNFPDRKPPLFYRIKRWFRNLFAKFDRPEKGLFGNDLKK